MCGIAGTERECIDENGGVVLDAKVILDKKVLLSYIVVQCMKGKSWKYQL